MEKFTVIMLVPKRYKNLLMPIYEAAVPVLEEAGKGVMVRYDGELRGAAD